ncbi:hypothetical protein BpHYR1_043078 [Brachionus plicatilis]|uniref:Uncharacterized protein n=1 Tax=Brachionus plicatilis TaxID=10195 RepID=A0A3M7RIM8_BRAPC|nr:hypothetical protein BpHYR1_043078 [Brachionus plicatilis]
MFLSQKNRNEKILSLSKDIFIQYLSKLNENGTKLNLRFTDNQLLNVFKPNKQENEKKLSLIKVMFIQYLSKLNENSTKLNLRFTESTLSAVKTFFCEKNKFNTPK